MLFLLFGSSASGKTTALNGLRRQMPALAVHDFDEIGVPSDADTAWRQHANETWVRRALDLQSQGRDLVLAGQIPFGEVLATPSAADLEAISACLLDCDEETRAERIRARGPEWLDRVPGDLEAHLAWAEWMRRHASDPAWRQHVIRQNGADGMRWERWETWREGDPRWNVRVLDSSHLTVEQVVDELLGWIEQERALVATESHPLVNWAT